MAASRSIRADDTGTGAIPEAAISVLLVEAGFTPGPVLDAAAGCEVALPGGGGPAGGGVAGGPSGMGGGIGVPELGEPNEPPPPPPPENPPPAPPPMPPPPPPPVEPAVCEMGAAVAGSVG
ncbi:MAG: hypothetical protein QOI01_1161 [Mycobacterium sp.]|nr:hypothetical protein [Mycobacterium sp.]